MSKYIRCKYLFRQFVIDTRFYKRSINNNVILYNLYCNRDKNEVR